MNDGMLGLEDLLLPSLAVGGVLSCGGLHVAGLQSPSGVGDGGDCRWSPTAAPASTSRPTSRRLPTDGYGMMMTGRMAKAGNEAHKGRPATARIVDDMKKAAHRSQRIENSRTCTKEEQLL